MRRWWKRIVAFWIADEPTPQYTRMDRRDGLDSRGRK